MNARKWLIRGAVICVGAVALGAVAIVAWSPAVAAYACPSCYGLEQVGDDVFVEAGASDDEIAAIAEITDAAAQTVRAFYGVFDARPTLLFCVTDACDRRLGGDGAKARIYGRHFVHVSPDGWNETILAHEFVHFAFDVRVRSHGLSPRDVAAWFDEGHAVIVAADARFLDLSDPAAPECRAEPRDDLPVGKREWSAAARADRQIYASAACRALRMMGGVATVKAVDALLVDIAPR